VTANEFWTSVQKTLHTYDLLTHPFYRAWTAGQLTRGEIGFYGRQYLQHVAAFPTYLTALHCRLEEGETRKSVLRTAAEEEAIGTSHADLWRQFVEGIEPPKRVHEGEVLPEIRQLVATYRALSQHGPTSAALGAFYAYESQVPRISEEKLTGLKGFYRADERTCEYFALHMTADLHHARVWRTLLDRSGEENAAHFDQALDGLCQGAEALWRALDGIDAARRHLADCRSESVIEH
jgi:pyrroloquinoline-quinone synthase